MWILRRLSENHWRTALLIVQFRLSSHVATGKWFNPSSSGKWWKASLPPRRVPDGRSQMWKCPAQFLGYSISERCYSLLYWVVQKSSVRLPNHSKQYLPLSYFTHSCLAAKTFLRHFFPLATSIQINLIACSFLLYLYLYHVSITV